MTFYFFFKALDIKKLFIIEDVFTENGIFVDSSRGKANYEKTLCNRFRTEEPGMVNSDVLH
jgi:ribosome maturation protein Sdo1